MKRKNQYLKNRLNLFSYDVVPLGHDEKKILSKLNINCIESNAKNRHELIDKLRKISKKTKIHIILIRLGINFNFEVYKFLNNPKIVLTYTTGINHITLSKKISDLKIIKLEKSDKSLREVPSTAELTIGLILNSIRKINEAQKDVKKKYWRRELFFGEQLKDLTVGVIGNGRIGSKIVKFCRSFNSKVLTYDIVKNRRNSSLTNLLRSSDIVTLHMKYSSKMKNYFNKHKFEIMKKNSHFINTSRGEFVNENDLITAIKSKKINGAALDVLWDDSISARKINKKNMLKIINFSKSNERLIITPHIGGATYGAMKTTRKIILDKLSKFLQ